jgi:hypothetical protein
MKPFREEMSPPAATLIMMPPILLKRDKGMDINPVGPHYRIAV